MKPKIKPKLIVILGPTASGKTKLSIKLAKICNGEIISADSRQVYKGMDIGSGKITKKETEGVPHYLLDVASPKRKFTVAQYKKLALGAIKKIQEKNKIPILVGGTGLYIQAIIDNPTIPPVRPNWKLRKNLEKKPKNELFELYKKLDPEGAEHIDKQNKRRLIRAIEVSQTTKKSFWKQRKKGEPIFDSLQIGIKLDKESLKAKIKKRVEKIFKIGLEKEVKKLVEKYGWVPALDSIGYHEWKGYLEKKETKNKVKEKIALHTLQYSRRQMTWFKKDKQIHWINNYREAEKLVKKFYK